MPAGMPHKRRILNARIRQQRSILRTRGVAYSGQRRIARTLLAFPQAQIYAAALRIARLRGIFRPAWIPQ